MNNLILLIFISLLLMSTSTMTYAADEGEALYKSNRCATCHGPKGVKTLMPVYPKLASQNKAYLLQVMKEMKNGNRTEGMSSVMQPSLQGLSEAEMVAIAEWLSHLE
jgi:cytochrome c